jgi:hypothetical protein
MHGASVQQNRYEKVLALPPISVLRRGMPAHGLARAQEDLREGPPGAVCDVRRIVYNRQHAFRVFGWYRGLRRKRVYQRFVMSFALRTEDEYSTAGNLVGLYDYSAAGASPTPGTRDNTVFWAFQRYVAKAKSLGVMPDDWIAKDDAELEKFAIGDSGIYFAVEKSDVVEQFGYASGEHFVLRSLAESILGPLGNWELDDE